MQVTGRVSRTSSNSSSTSSDFNHDGGLVNQDLGFPILDVTDFDQIEQHLTLYDFITAACYGVCHFCAICFQVITQTEAIKIFNLDRSCCFVCHFFSFYLGGSSAQIPDTFGNSLSKPIKKRCFCKPESCIREVLIPL
jgi:hypothetical protein